ncbi:MAG: esterase-like activity of phytase family protein [Synechococcales bacterium]|nr:esterase-like activity of phytase family protein [Synechococcales bacterium]
MSSVGQTASSVVQPTLVGFASLPADTFAEGPPSGADNGSGQPISGNGRTGPFDGQPIQGFSGVQFAPGSEGDVFWFLSDNGFGGQSNSADYLLRLYQVDPDFVGSEDGDGSVEVQGFVQLADPNELIPFDIVNEDTSDRLLTGADFDIESIVITGDSIWIGDEFGPFILEFGLDGVLKQAPIPTPNFPEFVELDTLNGQAPIVIGHRGASGLRPEHTLEAYELAIEQGADFIEPDLVVTKDGVLVARHENEISGTTDVADRPEFADRQTTKIIDGIEYTGWFVEDFTLAELKTLRATERIPGIRPDNTEFNGLFEVPTLAEVIDLVKRVEAETGKKIGIYPETKHPTFLAKEGTFVDGTPINLDTSQILVDTLIEEGFTDPSRIFIQSFEVQNLIEIQARLNAEGLGDIPLVQLYGDTTDGANPDDSFSFPYDIRYNVAQGNDLAAIYGQEFLDTAENPISADTVYADLDSPEMLQLLRDLYAEGAGPWKNNILLREAIATPVDGNGDGVAQITTQLTGEITSFIEDAHAAGLQVHPYTHRNEEVFLTLNPDGTPQTPESELAQIFAIGADGIFTDFPGTGDLVRDQIVAEFVQAAQNPFLEDPSRANLPTSRGYEGMAYSPDLKTLYPMLEGPVVGDPNTSRRIYEFDVETSTFTDLIGFYGVDDPSYAIGDFTPINETEFLVIERDGGQGESAAFKKIFKIDISNIDADGFVEKELVVDLLDIADPDDLNGDGDTTFTFPFVTIEDVLVLDENTILVANDNNYPFSLGRGPDIDNNEIIQIELGESLDLDPRLGVAALTKEIFQGDDGDDFFIGTDGDDLLFGEDGDDDIRGALGDDQIYGGAGNDELSGDRQSLRNGGDDLIEGGDGNDSIFGRGGNDELYGEAGDDRIFGNFGDDLLDGGLGNDNLNGGNGSDTYVLAAGEGTDTIRGFDASEDFIALKGGLSVDSLGITQVAGDTAISFGSETLAILKSVVADELVAAVDTVFTTL